MLMEKLGNGIYAQFDFNKDRQTVLKDKDNHECAGCYLIEDDNEWPQITTDDPPRLQTFFRIL